MRSSPFFISLSFFFSSRRRHTRYIGDWSSDVCLPIYIAGNLIGGSTNNAIEQPGSGGNFIGGGGYLYGPNIIHSNSQGVFIGAGSAHQMGPNVNDSFKIGRASCRERV